ncbi:MAG: ribonuclease HII [Williamsia sp.]|nr:ribonuclease HII [Williamsia sp.]
MLEPFYRPHLAEAGCDEAGRGAFAGPVFAAAVILPRDFFHPLLNDSKQVKPAERTVLRTVIEQEALAYAVAMVEAEEIDSINILQASMKAMHLAIGRLAVKPSLLLIDGNYFVPYDGIAHQCFVKGDSRYASIAAASILAKTYRDEYMQQLHTEFPHYGWHANKGYGTKAHREAIGANGICQHHRKSFQLFQEKE